MREEHEERADVDVSGRRGEHEERADVDVAREVRGGRGGGNEGGV